MPTITTGTNNYVISGTTYVVDTLTVPSGYYASQATILGTDTTTTTANPQWTTSAWTYTIPSNLQDFYNSILEDNNGYFDCSSGFAWNDLRCDTGENAKEKLEVTEELEEFLENLQS